MTLSTEVLPASDDHVSPYPVVPSAPCCGRPITDYEPPVPAWALNGMVVEMRQAMNPALRGLDATRPWMSKMSPGPRLGSCGCDGGARRTAMSGLGFFNGFGDEIVSEATEIARSWAASTGFALPPTPTDVIDALWRLAQTERDLEVLRQKLRAMRAAGATLSVRDIKAYQTAADAYYASAVQMYTPLRNLIRSASPAAASIIPPVSRPPSLDAPDRAIPWVPTEADMVKIRSGDLSAVTGRFATLVSGVRGRMGSGVAGLRGLGLFGIDDLTIGALVLIVIGLLALAAVAIAAAYTASQIASVVIAWTATKAATDVATRRREVYETCAAGGGASAACAADAERVVPMPVIPPTPSPVNVSAGGVFAVVAIGAAAYFLGTSGGRKMVGLDGLKRRRRSRRR